jgi:hypothetical protein
MGLRVGGPEHASDAQDPTPVDAPLRDFVEDVVRENAYPVTLALKERSRSGYHGLRLGRSIGNADRPMP